MKTDLENLDISLISPLFASLAKHVSEIGIRMGLAFSVLSLAGLAGTPITGALLTSELKWARPIAFSAVRLSLLPSLCDLC
jgi:MFS transporter, MCT family, solute carrier family 16 (monocarboxylic acid transporters), member 10